VFFVFVKYQQMSTITSKKILINRKIAALLPPPPPGNPLFGLPSSSQLTIPFFDTVNR
jgi:hypothetical protein